MLRLNHACVLLIGLAAAIPACGGGDDDDDDDNSAGESGTGGTTSGKGGTGGTSSGKGGTTSTGGTSSGRGGTSSGSGGSSGGSSVECTNGGVSYYETWYSNEACKAYWDCYTDVVCVSSGLDAASCQMFVEDALAQSFCYPEGTELNPESLTVGCEQALMSMVQAYPDCAP